VVSNEYYGEVLLIPILFVEWLIVNISIPDPNAQSS
jgi:hypothetical protein